MCAGWVLVISDRLAVTVSVWFPVEQQRLASSGVSARFTHLLASDSFLWALPLTKTTTLRRITTVGTWTLECEMKVMLNCFVAKHSPAEFVWDGERADWVLMWTLRTGHKTRHWLQFKKESEGTQKKKDICDGKLGNFHLYLWFH